MKNRYANKLICLLISLSVAVLFLSGCKSERISHALPESPKTDRIVILEHIVYHAIDSNNDGKYEALSAELKVQIIKKGFYIITGVLEKDDKLIASQPCFECSMPTEETVGDAPGIHLVKLVFSGEEILRSGENGPYELEVVALDQLSFAVRRFTTPVYENDLFGEY